MTQNQALIRQATQSLTKSSKPLQGASLVPALRKNGRAELSVFTAEQATPQQIATSIMKLSKAFPSQSVDFFNLLAERIDSTGMSADRLNYAINHLLDNHPYKTITIADLLSIDSRVEVLSYSEMIAECHKRGCTTDEYAPIWIGNEPKPCWVSKVDKERYKLPERI